MSEILYKNRQYNMEKFIIYQVLPRLFGNQNNTNIKNGTIEENGSGKFNDFTNKALKKIKALGCTHIWYTGIIEHATQTDYSNYGITKDFPQIVKGKAGSPYAIKDYYDVDPDLAVNVDDRMLEFEALVERTHKVGMKVIIDFVPNHVARFYESDTKPENVEDFGAKDKTDHAFHQNNNFYYLPDQDFSPYFDKGDYSEHPAKATGNDQFTARPNINDWYETVKLNYGVDYLNNREQYFDPIPDTWHKMLDILMFWADKKVDGFRCDMAEMVPVEFWNWVIPQVKKQHPNIFFIAEIYNPHEYRNYIFNGGFDYLYDKVGMCDLLKNITINYTSASSITQAWQTLSGIENNILHFLENHDEQRIASDFFAGNPWKILPALIVSSTLTKAPFMLYSGQELGEKGMDEEGFSGLDGRTTIFDYWGVESVQRWSNQGNYDGKLLSKDQQRLRAFYKKIMNIALKEKAIAKGKMYDLQYANQQNDFFNPERQFVYIRQYKDELLLIAVNFDDKDVSVAINIPHEAFDFLKIQSNIKYKCIDLLDGAYKFTGVLHSTQAFRLQLQANNGRIIKLYK